MTGIFYVLLRKRGFGADTEIRVRTENWPWRRKFSRRSCRDSNPRPFGHESVDLALGYSRYPCSLGTLLSLALTHDEISRRFISVSHNNVCDTVSFTARVCNSWIFYASGINLACLLLRTVKQEMVYTCVLHFLFVIHVWHPSVPLNGTRKDLICTIIWRQFTSKLVVGLRITTCRFTWTFRHGVKLAHW